MGKQVGARGTRGRVAAVAIGALLAAASVVPATAAQADASTTVHGTVQSGATRLAGVPVGFWSRTGHQLARTTTGAGGAFTLHVPSGVRGFAYAGTRPDGAKAVFAVAGRPFVRGVIGASQGRTTSYRISQGHASATAAGLAGGGTLHFRLQRPGRIVVHGGRYFAGTGDSVGVLQVLRLNGGFVDEVAAKGPGGVLTTGLLVPGAYRLHYFPQPPYLRRTVGVTVYPGGSTTLSPEFVRGATVSGTITSGGAPVAGVTVTAYQSPAKTGSAKTDANGHYSIGTLAAGRYTLTVGVNDQGDPEDLPEDPADIPPPSSDDFLVKATTFRVDAKHDDRTVDLALTAAGHVTGTVHTTASSRVYVEDATKHVVRVGIVDRDTHGFAVGGLTPGATYRLYAVAASGSAAAATYDAVTVTATTNTQTRDLTPSTPALTLSGRVPRATGGEVAVSAAGSVLPRFGASGTISQSGAYTVHGLIPGAYAVTTLATGRMQSRPSALTLAASAKHDAARGALAGGYRVRFVSGSAPTRRIQATATDSAGDRIDLNAYPLNGRAEAAVVHPGTYSLLATSFRASNGYDVPAADGPWWFGAPKHAFTVRSGATTNDGTIALHVHASL